MTTGMPEDRSTVDELCINTIRTLSMDAVQAANSGHPGAPMGLAAAAYVLWTRVLKHDPKNPSWSNRDRFVLSGGHASMLIYSLLHLTGYDLSLDDIKQFRQWGSKTPGHPEYGLTPGVETTTGPLAQGFSNAVGMAMAERHLSRCFNRPGFDVVDHYTYMMCGDGDMMEGVASEAASLAGHLGLARLICLYDDNKISIEGGTDLAFTEDVALRFKAYNWHVRTVDDGNDTDAIYGALKEAETETDRPSLILLRTHIAYGSPNKQDTASAHGAPLGEDEVKLTKKNLGWDENATFLVPETALDVFRKCIETGKAAESSWQGMFRNYAVKYSDLADRLTDAINGDVKEGWDKDLPDFSTIEGAVATHTEGSRRCVAVSLVRSVSVPLPTHKRKSSSAGGGRAAARSVSVAPSAFRTRDLPPAAMTVSATRQPVRWAATHCPAASQVFPSATSAPRRPATLRASTSASSSIAPGPIRTWRVGTRCVSPHSHWVDVPSRARHSSGIRGHFNRDGAASSGLVRAYGAERVT